RAAGRFGAAAQPDVRLRHRVPRLVLASLVMGAGLLAALSLAGDGFAAPGLRYLALAALVAGGAALYAASAFATGAVSGKDLRRFLRRAG
ncbi:MAG: lipid II flippase MurJ, partial [Pseudomonadota bacterium]